MSTDIIDITDVTTETHLKQQQFCSKQHVHVYARLWSKEKYEEPKSSSP